MDRWDLALAEGMTVGRLRLRRRDVGGVRLPSGKLVVCDPVDGPTAIAAISDLPAPGTVRVQVTDLERPGEGEGGPLLHAVVRLGPGKVVRWDPEPRHFKATSGIAALFDSSAAPLIERREALVEELQAAGYFEAGFGSLDLTDFGESGPNLVFFNGGYGEERVEYRVGRGTDGRPVVLVLALGDQEHPLLLRGGPWDFELDPSERLGQLVEFLEEYGHPRQDWVDAYLPGGNLEEAWKRCPSGALLLKVLSKLAHPSLKDALLLALKGDAELLERFGLREMGRPFRALEAGLSADGLPVKAVEEEHRELSLQALTELDLRHPAPDSVAALSARVRGRRLEDPSAKVREALRQADLKLADGIRALAGPPKLDPLARAIAKARSRLPSARLG